jgi:osmotically-inducible protein OsmY
MYRKNLRGLQIKALTINKVVTLSGMADTEFQKEEIEYIAMQTKGVERVINQITVRGGGVEGDPEDVLLGSSDKFVESRVERSISLNRDLSVRRVEVEVDGGVCYLTGSVQTAAESRLAESIAINTGGVREVRNMIDVRSDVSGGDIYLDVLEPVEGLDLEPLEAGSGVEPTSGDTPLFSEGARID